MTNGQAEGDPVESSSYRKILYETFPLSKLERQFLDPLILPYDQISHLTAHQIAFADCKVGSQHVFHPCSAWISDNMIGASSFNAVHHYKVYVLYCCVVYA